MPIRRGGDPCGQAACATVPVGQGQVCRSQLCSSVPGGGAAKGADGAGSRTPEAARKQAGAGTRWESRHWHLESSLIGRGPESSGGRQAWSLSETPEDDSGTWSHRDSSCWSCRNIRLATQGDALAAPTTGTHLRGVHWCYLNYLSKSQGCDPKRRILCV